jgi:hypothetical protein
MLRDLVQLKTDDVQNPEKDKNIFYTDTVKNT